MESNPSCLSSQPQDAAAPPYVQPHYKEAYRLAIYALLCGGRDAYEEFVRAEQIGAFLSEEEIFFILENAELPVTEADDSSSEAKPAEKGSSSTYFPTESDEEVPDLDLGWPQVTCENVDTNISLLFHPPRQNTPTIKEVVRRQIQEAKQLIAIAMDVFTDVDIFKEIVTAALRGVVVYILLDCFQYDSFLTMVERLGVRLHDLKNVRVRTVRGQQYQCRSGAKFHGALEQKFMLVDCKTVLYGTYSFMWSFEKINMSMVLVITGQLVESYDEEFRRLFARSSVPLSKERPCEHPTREPLLLQSPTSSQHSLHRLHMRSRVTHGLRSAKDNGFNGGALTRGMSMQDRLNKAHHPDMNNLVRGHSYGGDLQRLNATSQLMRDGRSGTQQRGGQDSLATSRSSQNHQKHLSRYGSDQHLIPFNSETSLHKWKINSYMSNSNASADMPYDVTSPHGSQSGLNDNQLQFINKRSLDIKSRLEDVRLKRLSLQEYISPRQSQESLFSAISALERSKGKPLLQDLDKSKSTAELEQTMQSGVSMEPADYGDMGGVKAIGQQGNQVTESRTERNQPFTPVLFKAASQKDITDGKAWQEPLSRTTSAGHLDMKSKDPPLKHYNVRHSRAMESLFEMPEEKDGLRESQSSINKLATSSGPDAQKWGNPVPPKEERTIPTVNLVSGGIKDQSSIRGSLIHSHGSAALNDGKQAACEDMAASKPSLAESNTSVSSQYSVESKTSVSALQRMNSLRSKVQSLLTTSDEHKSPRKEEKMERKNSVRSQKGSKQKAISAASPVGKSPALEQTPSKDKSSSLSRSQNAISELPDVEKMDRSSALLKKRMDAVSQQELGSRVTLDGGGSSVPEPRRLKAYSRFEHFIGTERKPPDKPVMTTVTYNSERDRSSIVRNSRDLSASSINSCSTYQTQTAAENKLGRFMQRFGHLIGKNK